MSQTPHGASQRDHGGITFRELVEASHDPAVLFQPAKHALDDSTERNSVMARRYELTDEAWDVVSDLFIETHGRGRPRLSGR